MRQSGNAGLASSSTTLRHSEKSSSLHGCVPGSDALIDNRRAALSGSPQGTYADEQYSLYEIPETCIYRSPICYADR